MTTLLTRFKDAWQQRSIHQQVWALTLPMILSNISVPLVGTVDTMIVGHLHNAEMMASVGIASSLYLFLVAIFNFLRMGTTGFTAQAVGQENGNHIRQILLQGLLLALLFAGILLLFASPITTLAFHLMQLSPALLDNASQFLNIRLFGLPAALLNFALIGWFLGMQNARVPLYILLATNISNILFSLLFVLHFEMGITGVAKAAVLAEWLGVITAFCFLPKMLKSIMGQWRIAPLQYWHNWRPLIFVNRDIFIRSVILQFAFFLVTIQGSRLGGDIVAANMIILNGLLLISYLLDGFAHAIEALTGKAVGEQNNTLLQNVMLVAGSWAFLVALLFLLFFGIFGHYFIDLISDISAVRETAYPLMPYLTLLPLISVWSYLLDGLFIGATKAREMRNGMLLAFILALPIGYLLATFGNDGLWITFLLFMALRGVIMGYLTYHLSRQNRWFEGIQ
ncbi:MATE family efflux transporter [Ignatzschineria larvae DSM 13226]|uniref:MATE family efflux transporter n=1 Tax=Ignatzschineria larvae DSM 13226 TaxID=1111732 RepID=A0ABZ3BZV2_9GAMM|nr:MATE family efflux transporter [Ignatzschineria larvae]